VIVACQHPVPERVRPVDRVLLPHLVVDWVGVIEKRWVGQRVRFGLTKKHGLILWCQGKMKVAGLAPCFQAGRPSTPPPEVRPLDRPSPAARPRRPTLLTGNGKRVALSFSWRNLRFLSGSARPELPRRDADEALEVVGELALVREAGAGGDLRQGEIAIG